MAKPPRSSRRDFLQGRSALDALTHASDQLANDWPEELGDEFAGGRSAGSSAESFLIQISRRAMACQFEVFLNAGEFPGGEEYVLEALDVVDLLEEHWSVFREASEVSRLNQTAAEEPVEVTAELFQLLQLSQQLYETTGGAFDITSSVLSKLWGFHRREGRLPSDQAIAEVLPRVGSCWLQLEARRQTVRLLKPGVEINLGAIGKGGALDHAAQHLLDCGIDQFLFHGGASSIIARGSRAASHSSHSSKSGSPGSEPSVGWSVGVRHPLRPEKNFMQVRLRDQALSTSGSGAQFFHHQGKRLGHILDPRSGRPAESVLSATVIADSAAEADALSTAFYVTGAEAAMKYCRQRPELGAVLVIRGSRRGAIEVLSEGMDQQSYRLFDGVSS